MKTAICAIVKDEHLYLTEWIEHHLNLGFNEIHIFEDKGSKSHKELITKENVILHSQDESPEIIEILSNRTAKRQIDLYNRFMSINRDQLDNYLKLRLDSTAQWEIRQTAIAIKESMKGDRDE